MIESSERFNELWRAGRADAEAGVPSNPVGSDDDERAVYAAGYANDPGLLMVPAEAGSDDGTFDEPVPASEDEPLGRLRAQLIEMISGASENRYAAGWDIGISRELLAEGGLWEIIGRVTGWPVGVEAEGGWQTWDQARAAAGLDQA